MITKRAIMAKLLDLENKIKKLEKLTSKDKATDIVKKKVGRPRKQK